MIVVLLIAVLAVAGAVWLFLAWKKIDQIEAAGYAEREILRELLLAEIHRAEHRIDLVLSAHTYEQTVQRERLTDELAVRDRQLADQNDILRGIVQFLDDVPQNFRFDRAPETVYRLRLPDRLRMELTSQDQS